MNEPTASSNSIALAGPLPTGGLATLPRPALEQVLTTLLLTNQFAYVYDHVGQALTFVSAGVTQLLGECPSIADLTPDWFRMRVHPDDALAVQEAQAVVGQYLVSRQNAPLVGFRFSLDYRLRHTDGRYRRVLHEHQLLERDPNTGVISRSLHLFTDLTHHKRTQEVRFHVNQPDFAAFTARQRPGAPSTSLTRREQQILVLVLQGLTSRQIAYELKLREHSVKSHRRNISRKTATHGFQQLLAHLSPVTGQHQ